MHFNVESARINQTEKLERRNNIMFMKLFDLLEQRRSRNTVVAITLVLYGVIVCYTLSITPIAWEDEMQILAFGHRIDFMGIG